MGTKERQDDARRTGDALDRVIDEAIGAALGAAPVNLRGQVLARLDEAPEERPSPGPRFGFLLRPALLPTIGALLLVAGVGVLWRQADRQLSSHVSRSAAARPSGISSPSSQVAATIRPKPVAVAPATPAVAGPDAGQMAERSARRRPARRDSTGPLLYAAAGLRADSGGLARVTGAAFLPDADADEPALPGAPAGNLGDPVAPMPRPRPIVIQPLATPPIPDAPPISTLGKPVGTLADDVSRDRQEPGKPGGM